MVNRNLRLLYHPYYVTNILLSIMFFLTKTIPFLCTQLYDTCSINLQEYELLIFLGSFVALRSKRQFSILDYLSHFCMFAKIVSLLMFWKQSIVYAILFAVLWLLHACFLQKPIYNGPDKVLYLRDLTFDQEVLHGDPKITWIIAFYTVWSPTCIKLQPIFAEISEQFGRENLKFGKLDIIRYPQFGSQFNIDTSGWSKQLPTLILFRKGRELVRRPALINNPKKSVQKFVFNYETIVSAFNLNEFVEGSNLVQSNSESIDENKKNA